MKTLLKTYNFFEFLFADTAPSQTFPIHFFFRRRRFNAFIIHRFNIPNAAPAKLSSNARITGKL